jgi:hypothetical protein
MKEADLFLNGMDEKAVVERVPDKRPVPPFKGPDQYFDEPDVETGKAEGIVKWSVRAKSENRQGLLKFAQWCNEAPDGERRAIMILLGRFQGRTPDGSIEETAKLAHITRRTVSTAIKRFTKYFPGAIATKRKAVSHHGRT